MLFSNNWDIISIVLSSVIPYCIKYDSVNNFNVVTLVGKIGKEISNIFYKNEWQKYSTIYSDKDNLLLNNLHYFLDIKNYEIKIINISDNNKNNSIIFSKNLTENEFNNKWNIIIGDISDDDYFLLELDLLEFISDRSQLYIIKNILIDKNTFHRIIFKMSTLIFF